MYRRRRRKKFIEYPSKKELDHAFKEDVLEHPDFQRHIRETAKILNVSEELVHDVVVHHNLFVLYAIAKKRTKSILRIALFGFLKLDGLIDPKIYELKKRKNESTIKRRDRENEKN